MKLTLTTFLSLDGVMQAPGGPDEDPRDFERGGWQVPFVDDDFIRIGSAHFEAADAFLLGRRTYEIFAGHWPHVTDPESTFARQLNSLPKYVVSSTLTRPEWAGTAVIDGSGDVVAAIRRLKEQAGDELQVHGSGELARTLIANDLVDEYRLWFTPVVVGSGRRLFADAASPRALRLVGSQTTAAGVTVNTYRPDGEATYGSFALEAAAGA